MIILLKSYINLYFITPKVSDGWNSMVLVRYYSSQFCIQYKFHEEGNFLRRILFCDKISQSSFRVVQNMLKCKPRPLSISQSSLFRLGFAVHNIQQFRNSKHILCSAVLQLKIVIYCAGLPLKIVYLS